MLETYHSLNQKSNARFKSTFSLLQRGGALLEEVPLPSAALAESVARFRMAIGLVVPVPLASILAELHGVF